MTDMNLDPNDVVNCLRFFEKAVPKPQSKNFHTQLGCHCEEIVEMLIEVAPLTEHTQKLVDEAKVAMHNLANHLKAVDGVIAIPGANRANFLDAICDQLVTAIGTAYMQDMDVKMAFDLVNRSNLSKFDEKGDPIFDENKKIMKGPNYFKADLSIYA